MPFDLPYYILYDIFLGMLGMMLLYVAFNWVATKQRGYLFYGAYILGQIIFFCEMRGNVLARVAPTIADNWRLEFTGVIVILLYNLFADDFLDLKLKSPRMHRLVRLNVWVSVAALGALIIIKIMGWDYGEYILNTTKLFIYLCGLSIIIAILRWKDSLSRYLVTGSLFLISLESINIFLMAVCKTNSGLSELRYLSPDSLVSHPSLFSQLGVLADLLFLTLGLVRKNHQIALEQIHSDMERKNAVEQERQRIARDMHDDLGSGLSALNLLSKSLQNSQLHNTPLHKNLSRIGVLSQDLNLRVREIIWTVSGTDDTINQVIFFLRRYTAEFCEMQNISFNSNIKEAEMDNLIDNTVRRNLFLCLKEFLNNVAKYSTADALTLNIIATNSYINLTISENGAGFDKTKAEKNKGNGLRNITERMHEIDGTARWDTTSGVQLTLNISLQ